MRAALSNRRTREEDVDIAWQAMNDRWLIVVAQTLTHG
jgi:hypothetical protein